MARNLSVKFGLPPLDDIDATILRARRHMEQMDGFLKGFDMYTDKTRPLWDFKPIQEPTTTHPTTVIKEPNSSATTPDHPKPSVPAISDLADATFLDKSFLQDIQSLLESKQQLIFEGPPGSGKTFVAEKFARYFTGQPLTGERNHRVELVQFHQSYSYEDFVEGIRPETKDGQLHYNVKPGIFRKFAKKAAEDIDNPYVLIIDEINRGNVSRILGELMLLLEYRHETATLPYSQESLSIPPNLYIIGTMNSADRSLSQIDYALRRRFYFVRFMSVVNGEAPVLERWLNQQPIDQLARQRILDIFIELNRQLRNHLDSDDFQVGHSYLMNERVGEQRYRENVWKYAVIPLIREYLYHHRERDELLATYELAALRAVVQPIAQDITEPVERVIGESTDVGEQ